MGNNVERYRDVMHPFLSPHPKSFVSFLPVKTGPELCTKARFMTDYLFLSNCSNVIDGLDLYHDETLSYDDTHGASCCFINAPYIPGGGSRIISMNLNVRRNSCRLWFDAVTLCIVCL